MRSWKRSDAYLGIKDRETQLMYYERMGACKEVRKLVALDSKQFGTVSERIITELFQLQSRTSSQNDATKSGVKIEIKSARYWAGADHCVW